MSQEPYRRLYGEILESNSNVYEQNLLPWLESFGESERDWLVDLASSAQTPPWPDASAENLWRLYALSRVNQLLLLAFQRGGFDGEWQGPDVSPAQYLEFFGRLGLGHTSESEFHPFFHEIVHVAAAEDLNERPRLEAVHWPGLMLGNMMFSRAGCSISAGRAWANKPVAESSTLYWAFRRKHRKFEDPSHGWGSNSQWRTSFRRDFRAGDRYFYNVDGEEDLASVTGTDEQGLSPADRLELLRHRCLVTSTTPDQGGLWVYDYRFIEEDGVTPQREALPS
ncbi:MAG: hypothetical protein AAFQ65_05975 [Myxococcota bacterium]